ncbi:MAG: glycoside hydrolase family 9 protein [Lachnospiraceae bacterium]|nr:glycoside hydrolase family 9 protein [Lachnospiraceae bacterium]
MSNETKGLPVIRINQVGYAPNLPKLVAVTAAGDYELKDESGAVVRRFENVAPKADEASGDEVALLSLGDLEVGRYELCGGGESRAITVANEPWREVTNALIKGLYYQRCDELPEKYAGVYKHPACHTGLVEEWRRPEPAIPEEEKAKIPPHFLKMLETPLEEPYGEAPAPRRIKGGWHDAGDYGKYVGPGAVTVAHLLYAWKLFPEGCSDELNIPESGNGVPDILNETRFELEWILQMQRADGAFYHKLTTERFAPFIMPEEDTMPEYLSPISRTATGDAVAALALAYRVYKPYDEDFAARCLASAEFGWKWLADHPERRSYRNPLGLQTGFYGDGEDHDERFWAACEMYAATGDAKFREAAEGFYREGRKLTQFGWAEVSGLGALCCLFDLKEKGGELLYDDLKQAFLRRSEWALLVVKNSGYGTAIPTTKYEWGSILTSMSNGMAMVMNYLLTGREDMREAALGQLDYALGRNALDISFITGYGERRVMFPHHRPSAADGIEEPVPGLISGGPNNKMNYPNVKDRLGDTPAAKHFIDETEFADMNEIAIYWNSPTVFVAAFSRSISI